jgi:4-hydroxyphenylpyruvate dioxygenase
MTDFNSNAFDDENGIGGLSGIEFIEFSAVSDTDFANLRKDFELLGFACVGRHRSKDVQLFRQGGINLILNREPSSFAHSFGTVHGVSVCALALRVNDAQRFHDFAVRQGAQDFSDRIGPGEATIPAIRTVSGRLLYLVDEQAVGISPLDNDFLLVEASGMVNTLTAVDHISQTVGRGETKKWVRFYSRCFGLHVVEHNNIVDPKGYTLSTVVADNERKIQFCLNEPVDDGTDCQRFLKENFGEGIQHIAFSTDDIFGFLDNANSVGLTILPIPYGYYDNLIAEGYARDLVSQLGRYNVMIDSEGGGRFLHAYVESLNGRIFFEIVERKNHHGFGRHDVTARLMAQEGVVTLRPSRVTPPAMPDIAETSIDGSTTLVGVLGDPTWHLRMPEIIGHWLALHGFNTVCVPLPVAADNLAAFISATRALKNLVGYIVALPHKQAVLPLLDEISPRAQRIGAVNVVRREADGRLVGDMVDGPGFVKGWTSLGGEVAGAKAWIIGAGSAGRAIAYASAEAGLRSVWIEDLVPDRAHHLVDALRVAYPDLAARVGRPPNPETVDIAVNATDHGMDLDDVPPFDPAVLRPGSWVAETILMPETTELLALAERHGCRLFPGRRMVECQIGDYARHFRWKD